MKKVAYTVLAMLMPFALSACGTSAEEQQMLEKHKKMLENFGGTSSEEPQEESTSTEEEDIQKRHNDLLDGFGDTDYFSGATDALDDFEVTKMPYTGYIYKNDEKLNIIGHTLEEVTSEGYKLDFDLSAQMASGEFTREMVLSGSNGDKYTIKAINPRQNTASAAKAEICYLKAEAGSNSANINFGDLSLGKADIDTVLDSFEPPYENDGSTLHYKCGPAFYSLSWEVGQEGGARIYESGNVDAFLSFKNGILDSIVLEEQSLLYLSLNDNLSPASLKAFNPGEAEKLQLIRDDILGDLKYSLHENGLDALVNPITGVVTLDNSVLFALDKYELSADGKAYLDDFIAAYAASVLSDKYANYIEELAIQGHTDDSGKYDYNLTLSQKRAETVMNYFSERLSSIADTKAKSIFDSKATATGYSYSDLIYNENGTVDAAGSRRVNFKIFINN